MRYKNIGITGELITSGATSHGSAADAVAISCVWSPAHWFSLMATWIYAIFRVYEFAFVQGQLGLLASCSPTMAAYEELPYWEACAHAARMRISPDVDGQASMLPLSVSMMWQFCCSGS